ncbi:MAG: uracil phosphoribosyltransferase [bacterium]|nr:uracil phosphoribosyltransferase [bacterium]
MIKIIDHPLAKVKLTLLRNKDTHFSLFRKSMQEISYILAINSLSDLELNQIEIETPLTKTKGYEIKNKLLIVPILRAGLGLLPGFTELVSTATVGLIGLKRDEDTLLPSQYYLNIPKNLEDYVIILLEPMVATGGSLRKALNILIENRASKVKVCSIIAYHKTITELESEYPFVDFYVLALDNELNEKGFIVPGLGDAGDRTFGTI